MGIGTFIKNLFGFGEPQSCCSEKVIKEIKKQPWTPELSKKVKKLEKKHVKPK